MINKIGESICRYMWQNSSTYIDNFVDSRGIAVNIIDRGYFTESNLLRFSCATVEVGGIRISGEIIPHSSSNNFLRWTLSVEARSKISTIHLIALESSAEIPLVVSDVHRTIIFCIVPDELLYKYFHISNAGSVICGGYFETMDHLSKLSAIDSLFVDRLQNRAKVIESVHKAGGESWYNTLIFTIFDSINIASRRNRVQFQTLKSVIKGYYILQNLNTIEDIEALLFGASGLLESTCGCDEYLYDLRNRFMRLARTHSIRPMSGFGWDIRAGMGMTIYVVIAQLAAIFHHHKSLVASLAHHESLLTLYQIVGCEISEYWQTHTDFGQVATSTISTISRKRVELLLINGILPFIYYYGRVCEIEKIDGMKILDYYSQIPPEENRLIRAWQDSGVTISNAYDSQAILELAKNYCPNRLCYICPIGTKMLRPKTSWR